MQPLLQCLFYLGSLFILAIYAEMPETGEWIFTKTRDAHGTIIYKPATLFAESKTDDGHQQCEGFSYNASHPLGPDHWGDVCISWATCKGNGGRQSPIDIITSNTVRQPTSGLEEKYQAVWNTTVINEHEVLNMYGVLLDKSNKISGGPLPDEFELLSFHYHIPSEHTIDGVRYPLELHLVHKSINKQPPELAVVGLLFDKSDEFNSTSLGQFTSVLSSFDDVTVPHISTTALLTLHNEIFPVEKEKTFYNYLGSLTTPPCAEIVNWLVMETPLVAGTAQIAYLASLIGDPKGDNSRPVQPLNNRKVTHFHVQTTHSGSIPPGGVAAIVLVLIGVLGFAIAYCSLSRGKQNRIVFCGKFTDYEFIGWLNPPFIRKASNSINASDEQEDGEEEEEEEAPKGKAAARKGRDDDEEEDEEHVTKGGPPRGGGGGGAAQKKKAAEEDEGDEERPRGDARTGKKHAGGNAYGTVDDEDFDAPSSKKSGGRVH